MMRRLLKGAAVLFAVMWCMGTALPAHASGNPSVVLESEGVNVKKNTLKVQCSVENMDQATNGKIRVTYDADKLRLLENQTGSAIEDSDALCEVNDCLTGNKKEGEIVYAFASAKRLPSEGCLASLNFAVSDKLAEGDEIKLAVSVDKLAGDTGELPAENKNLTVKFKKDDQNNNNNNNSNNDNDNNGGKRPGISNSNPSGSSSISESGSGSGGTGSSSRLTSNSGSSSRNSIKSSKAETASKRSKDNDSKQITSRKEGEEGTDSGEEEELKNSADNQVPLAGMDSESSGGWMLPVIILIIAAVIFFIYKKKKGANRES